MSTRYASIDLVFYMWNLLLMSAKSRKALFAFSNGSTPQTAPPLELVKLFRFGVEGANESTLTQIERKFLKLVLRDDGEFQTMSGKVVSEAILSLVYKVGEDDNLRFTYLNGKVNATVDLIVSISDVLKVFLKLSQLNGEPKLCPELIGHALGSGYYNLSELPLVCAIVKSNGQLRDLSEIVVEHLPKYRD